MRLRTRILAVSATVAIPMLLGLVVWDSHSRRDAAAAALASMLERTTSEQGAQARCEADPEGWGVGGPREPGPPPSQGPAAVAPMGGPPSGPGGEPPEGFSGRPWRGPPIGLNLDGIEAPQIVVVPLDASEDTLPPDLVVGLPQLERSPFWENDLRVWMATGWVGPCAVVRIEGNTVPGFMGSVLPASPVWLLPPLVLLAVLWFAVGPPVRRIQQLTDSVREGEDPIPVQGDDELGELARAFETSARQLREQVARTENREQALRDFVANTAHDVRIPLTVLIGHLSELEQRGDAELVGRALGEAHYLGALLSNLASHTRLEGPAPFTEVDLEGVIQRVVLRHQPLARRRDIQIHWGGSAEDAQVQGELTLIEQALSNLVYNAVRYNHSGGHVAVTVDEDDGGGWLLSVEDDGPGVPPENLARLTERGFRGKQGLRREGEGSQGLGLSIVARVAELHGWSLELGAGSEGGLRAVMRIPAQA